MTFELKNVRYCWKARHTPAHEIFRDLSVQIGHGESVGILGREGSGKTTMLTLLGG
ncbi:MAG TPA: ATP-binding cassette domain-containing protein, partial [Bacteroidota bacterium]|nr:ATP-binding cassette domain-containing protein [Bacteroidota bacterium]